MHCHLDHHQTILTIRYLELYQQKTVLLKVAQRGKQKILKPDKTMKNEMHTHMQKEILEQC